MYTPKQIKRLISKFNQTHDTSLFSTILDQFDIDRPKCIHCGSDIIYDNVKIYLTRQLDDLIYDEITIHDVLSLDDIRFHGTSFDSTCKTGQHLCVCKQCVMTKFNLTEFNNRSFRIIGEVTKYAFNIPDNEYAELSKTRGVTLVNCIKKHGETKGREVFNEYRKKQAYSNSLEYKQNRHGWSEEKFNEHNKSRAITKKNLTAKYGDELGLEKFNDYRKRQAYTNTYEYFTEQYGISTGEAIFNRTYGENRPTYSIISQDAFVDIDRIIDRRHSMTYFAIKNHEYSVMLSTRLVKLDYFINDINVAIEFNGTVYHADPRFYKSTDTPHPFNRSITAEQMWKVDADRYDMLLKERGIRTVVLWEHDYKDSKFNLHNFLRQHDII
jgi:hypothetical protein